jgi:ABC-2 type transport system ATP-binding protein
MHAIETWDLTRAFGDRVAVERLTFTAPRGAVFGFLGPNGAGKTTTVRMLAALIAPTSGSAVVTGYRLGEEDHAIRRNVGLLTESPGLYERLSARQNLLFFARLYDLDAARAEAQTERYLRMLGLWDRRDDPVGSFSKGMRQKLAIARALLHEPAIIFLDEPTAGLDPEAARTVREFIKELRAEGRTIFLTTHNLPEADELCDTIAVFRTRLLRIGAPDAPRRTLRQQHAHPRCRRRDDVSRCGACTAVRACRRRQRRRAHSFARQSRRAEPDPGAGADQGRRCDPVRRTT